jgi:hypothetical protein
MQFPHVFHIEEINAEELRIKGLEEKGRDQIPKTKKK